MSDRVRIGLMTPAWPGHNTANGITTSVFNLALGLRDIGQPPVILTGDFDGAFPEGIPITTAVRPPWTLIDRARVRFGRARTRDIARRKTIEAMVRVINDAREQHGLDIVIIEETLGWATEIMPRVPVPVVICLHGPWALLSAAFEQPLTEQDRQRIDQEARAFAAVPGLIAPSASSMSVAAKVAPDTPRAIIPNAYSAGAAPDSAERKPGHILFVGRVDRLKGADTVLGAFARLAARQPAARLTFAGPDRGLRLDDGRVVTMNEALADLPAEVRARIDYLGPQSSAAVADLRRSHPIALIASRYENLNYTLLEAMAAGQAIVSTAVGGPAEVLKEEETALLVPPGDPGAMAAALERLLDDPALATRLGQAARAKVEVSFHPETIAAETVAFCRKVLAHPTQT